MCFQHIFLLLGSFGASLHFLLLHFLLLETFCEIGGDLVVVFKAVAGSSQKHEDPALLELKKTPKRCFSILDQRDLFLKIKAGCSFLHDAKTNPRNAKAFHTNSFPLLLEPPEIGPPHAEAI